jgi:hypothetical protein
MVAVVVVALALGADAVRRRRDQWRDLGVNHESKARHNLRLAGMHAEIAAHDEAGAELHRAASLAAHGDGTHNAKGHSDFAAAFSGQADVERAAQRKCRALARYHRALRRKYDLAARYPWLPVEPDPPAPE